MAADTGSFGMVALVMQALMTIAFYSAELDLSEAANTAHPDDPAAADAAAHAAAADALPEENKGNREAERALLRIQDKLGGRVAGHPEALAVEGQVRALLDEARDPENLCKMFDGWAAWL